MPLDWVDWIDYNGVTFSVELLGGVRDRAALAGSFFTASIVLIYITCYQLSLQEPKAKPNLVPRALFPDFEGGAGKSPGEQGCAGSICPCFA